LADRVALNVAMASTSVPPAVVSAATVSGVIPLVFPARRVTIAGPLAGDASWPMA
jgi:hypothetical protein